MRQYDIWWANLPKPAGRRPVLLLSRDDAYSYLKKFVAVEITTTIRNIPVEVPLGRAEGMRKACVVNFDNIRTVSREYLSTRIATLADSRRRELKRAIGYALGWDELMGIE